MAAYSSNSIRKIAAVCAVTVLLGTTWISYQFYFLPMESEIEEVQKQVTMMQKAASQVENVRSEYQQTKVELRSRMSEKGLQPGDRWMIHSADNLDERLKEIAERNRAIKFEIRASQEHNQLQPVSILTLTTLPKGLYKILEEIDDLPPNVTIGRFNLTYENRKCVVIVHFILDLSHIESETPA